MVLYQEAVDGPPTSLNPSHAVRTMCNLESLIKVHFVESL